MISLLQVLQTSLRLEKRFVGVPLSSAMFTIISFPVWFFCMFISQSKQALQLVPSRALDPWRWPRGSQLWVREWTHLLTQTHAYLLIETNGACRLGRLILAPYLNFSPAGLFQRGLVSDIIILVARCLKIGFRPFVYFFTITLCFVTVYSLTALLNEAVNVDSWSGANSQHAFQIWKHVLLTITFPDSVSQLLVVRLKMVSRISTGKLAMRLLWCGGSVFSW